MRTKTWIDDVIHPGSSLSRDGTSQHRAVFERLNHSPLAGKHTKQLLPGLLGVFVQLSQVPLCLQHGRWIGFEVFYTHQFLIARLSFGLLEHHVVQVSGAADRYRKLSETTS